MATQINRTSIFMSFSRAATRSVREQLSTEKVRIAVKDCLSSWKIVSGRVMSIEEMRFGKLVFVVNDGYIDWREPIASDRRTEKSVCCGWKIIPLWLDSSTGASGILTTWGSNATISEKMDQLKERLEAEAINCCAL
jgi:hypothetical protein